MEEQPENIDEMLLSLSPQKSTGAVERNEQRKTPRFRVKWHADILVDEQCKDQGFIHDISTMGAAIYLNSSLSIEKCTLHIHVPPLNLQSESHVIEVSGEIVYVVYDGDKQLFRAAISFIRFHLESDRAYLDERLTKYHLKIPELC
jgi:hypothetical protein